MERCIPVVGPGMDRLLRWLGPRDRQYLRIGPRTGGVRTTVLGTFFSVVFPFLPLVTAFGLPRWSFRDIMPLLRGLCPQQTVITGPLPLFLRRKVFPLFPSATAMCPVLLLTT